MTKKEIKEKQDAAAAVVLLTTAAVGIPYVKEVNKKTNCPALCKAQPERQYDPQPNHAYCQLMNLIK